MKSFFRLVSFVSCFTGFLILSWDHVDKFLDSRTGVNEEWVALGPGDRRFPVFAFCSGEPFTGNSAVKINGTSRDIEEEINRDFEVVYKGRVALNTRHS